MYRSIISLSILLVVAGCLTSSPEEPAKISEVEVVQDAPEDPGMSPDEETAEHGAAEITDEQVLEIASQEPSAALFIVDNPGYQYEITELGSDEIARLGEKYPVIYGDLPDKTLHRVDYKEGNRGLLVIVDVEGGSVLKYFRTTGVTLG